MVGGARTGAPNSTSASHPSLANCLARKQPERRVYPNGGIWKCFHSGDGMDLPDWERQAHRTTEDRVAWDTRLVSLPVALRHKQRFLKIRYLEEDDEGQSCCQDAPVMLGEGVCVGGPGRLSVVFIPKPDQDRADHTASGGTFTR